MPHSCRIRDILRERYQLPNGIDTLRLPKRLQRYIDLTEELEAVAGVELHSQSQSQSQSCGKPMQSRLSNAVPRLDTIPSSAESDDDESEDESDNQMQLLEPVTDAEKAAVAAFVATGNGAITEEAKRAAVAAYLRANEARVDSRLSSSSTPIPTPTTSDSASPNEPNELAELS